MTGPDDPTVATPARRARRPVALLVVLAVLAGAGLTAVGLYAAGAFSTEIVAEPLAADGANPFMPAIGEGQAVTRPASKTGVTVTGDTAGLYGGTLNDATCDRIKLVTFLQQNPDKGAAWAGVLGIAADAIAGYVAGLTAVVLRSDTAVTNHGFADGRATTLNSVLEAGTAVLVDNAGVPRVRCRCGNPLTPARTFTRPEYSGERWPELAAENVTVVAPSPRPVAVFAVINLADNESTINRPAGSAGERDEGRLEDAGIAGTFTITRTLVACTGITDPDESCDDYDNQRFTWTVRCESTDTCAVDDVVFRSDGSSWNASGANPTDSSFRCFDVPVPTSFVTRFAPGSAATVDGRWAAQTLSGRTERRASGTSRCPDDFLFTWEFTGQRTG
ncbi:MAG: DUF6777 domain-containing protein [Pseudonocardia sp.]